MTNYTKTMREALQSMYISEDNIAILRDIVKRKSAMPLKFADGKMKVDLFTASAVTQALDKVNPANKAKITKLINTGKKANFASIAKVVMKSENNPEIEEEVKVEEVSLLAQQAAILISKRELERNPRKEEVELDEEKMPSHAELVKGKYGDAHAGAQHFSNIDGKVYTWNYLERKGGKYVVTTKKTGEIGLSRAGSKDFKTAKIVKEETELDEGQLKDMLAQAGDIEYYAKRSGGIDKKDMMKAASLLKKGNKSGALNFVSKLDTSPREKILDLMGEEVKLDEKMKPVDPKTAKMIAKIIATNKLDYNFEYGLSKNDIADIKKQGGKPPRGVGPMGGGRLYDVLSGLGDTDNDIYLDGADLVDGAKTIAKWKGMTVGDMLKKARLRYEEVEESYEFGTDEYTKHTKDVTPGQGKEIDEARPSARRDAMKAMGKRGKDSADDDDYVATADDRKAASRNIISQLRKSIDLGGTHEVTFKDKKKVKVKPEIAMAFIKKFEKMKPVDKAKLQDKVSKSYKDLLKGLKEEDTSMLGRIEKKLKEIKNG